MDIFLPLVAAAEWALKGISSLVGNAGLGIIIFTVLVRLLTFPLTNKAMKSSLTMQALSPLIREIQKKYKGDQTRIYQETQELYRTYGVSQLGGCLPLLLQIPIFLLLSSAIFGLTINKDPIFAQGFAWIGDLGKADPLHILPVASGLFQFIAQRMAIPPGRVLDGQAKMMNNIMLLTPIYIVFIYWGWAAGPVIYWTTSSILQAVQSFTIIGWGSLSDWFSFLPKSNTNKYMPAKLSEAEIAAKAEKRKGTFVGKLMEQSMAAQQEAAARKAEERGEAPNGDKAKEIEAPTRTITSSSTPSRSNGSSASISGGYFAGRSNSSNGASANGSNGASANGASANGHSSNGSNGSSNGNGRSSRASEPAGTASGSSSQAGGQQMTYEQMLARKKKKK